MHKVKRFSDDQKNQDSKLIKGLKVADSIAAAGLGAGIIDSSYRSGDITGRMHFYHGTNKENVDSILKSGILGSKSLDPESTTNRRLDGINLKSGKKMVFLGKSRIPAFAMKKYHKSLGGGQVLNVNIPYEEYKKMSKIYDNPEFRGAKNFKEWYKMAEAEAKRYGDSVPKSMARLYYFLFSGKKGSYGTRIVEGDISPEFIKQSDKYKKNTSSEMWRYIKNNPGRFAKGVAKTTAGAGLIGYGGYKIYDTLKDKKK